jgi:hypothetical protein
MERWSTTAGSEIMQRIQGMDRRRSGLPRVIRYAVKTKRDLNPHLVPHQNPIWSPSQPVARTVAVAPKTAEEESEKFQQLQKVENS